MTLRDSMCGFTLLILLAVLAPGCAAQTSPATELTTTPVPDWVPQPALASMQQRIDFGQNSTIAVAFIDEAGTAFHTVGPLDAIGLDANTIYEIGSVTKTFTAVLLADAVTRGDLSLDDPIDTLFPETMNVPGEGTITLAHLATHTSGFPRMPGNIPAADPLNPYAEYTRELLYEAVDGLELEVAVGAAYQYSNFGMGLLGRMLADRAGTSYEALVRERILEPLGMEMTAVVLDDAQQRRLMPGFRGAVTAPNWDFGELEGAGAIRSNLTDMSRYLAANMGLVDSPLTAAFTLSHTDRPEIGGTALGWHIAVETERVVWHNGRTGGYASFVGFVPDKKRGVVLLTNSSSSVDDLGFHILDSAYPLSRVVKSVARRLAPIIRRRGVKVAIAEYATIKANSAEEFDLSEMALNTLGYELLRESRVADAIEILELNTKEYPESGNVYDSLAEAHVANGDTDAAIANYKLSLEKSPGNLQAIEALKELGVEYEVPVFEVPMSVLEEYVGIYELAPQFFLEITIDGDRIRAQATSQDPFDLLAVSETMFAVTGVDARIEFTRNEEGKVDALTLHQQGSRVAKRVEG